MRRQRRTAHYTNDDDYQPATIMTGTSYHPLLNGTINDDMEEFLQMERINRESSHAQNAHRFENTIEAKVEVGDTLQALALRFHCTVADIKRLNKIDKDNEIHARKVVKIPVTVHSVLLETLPAVHKSGNNSPKYAQQLQHDGSETVPNIMRNPLEDARVMLSEKLMVAAVNSAGNSSIAAGHNISDNSINSIILNSTVSEGATIYTDEDAKSPLLSDILDDEVLPSIRRIPGPSLKAIDWSGSDCDMSWVCLFIVILALCFVIPLIYVIYLAEHHTPHHNATHSH